MLTCQNTEGKPAETNTHPDGNTRHVYTRVAMVYSSHATLGFHAFSSSLSEWNQEASCSNRDRARKCSSRTCQQVISQNSHPVWEQRSSRPGLRERKKLKPDLSHLKWQYWTCERDFQISHGIPSWKQDALPMKVSILQVILLTNWHFLSI